MKPVVISARTGCFIPTLIVLNLFFGWMFFPPLQWVIIGVVLTVVFVAYYFILAKKMVKAYSKRKNVIDIEGRVMERNNRQNEIS